MEKRTKAELLAWIEQHQPVTREKLLGAFEDMDYEQLQGWLSELQRKRKPRLEVYAVRIFQFRVQLT